PRARGPLRARVRAHERGLAGARPAQAGAFAPSRVMNFGRKSRISTGISVCDAMKLIPIQIASSPPISASKRMLENVQSVVLITIVAAVKVTPLPVVQSAVLVAS